MNDCPCDFCNCEYESEDDNYEPIYGPITYLEHLMIQESLRAIAQVVWGTVRKRAYSAGETIGSTMQLRMPTRFTAAIGARS